MRAEPGAVCGSCGDPATNVITLRGKPVPACLRHLNHWRTPAPDYTCPTLCVESNHPGEEHADWLAAPVPPVPDVREAVAAALAAQYVTLGPETVGGQWQREEVQRAADAVLAVPAIATALGEGGLRARVEAEALLAAAEAARYPNLGTEGNGHTSAYSVRKWLNERARAILAAQPTDADQ